ncbi:MAG: hypothetical protein KGP28_06035 [Bdellovibrionales bacterium]|nr:hypothetical protein [Bdellovibrionales bacterium]
MESFFKLHVIPPPRPLDWGSPRGLLRDTLVNHLIQDPAPIGHFYIEIKTQSPKSQGGRHVLTGMSRTNRNRSSLGVIRDQVGLGTFFYDFPGALDDARDAYSKLQWAKTRGRLKTICVPISGDRGGILDEELHFWMKFGSFHHYGGGHRILNGEGSGCAEFGVHFLNLALGKEASPSAWVRSVFAPRNLVGGARTGARVSMIRVFLEGRSWAHNEDSGILYSTPDMELAWKWLESRAPGQTMFVLSPEDFTESRGPARRIGFCSGYPEETEENLHELWRRVSVV